MQTVTDKLPALKNPRGSHSPASLASQLSILEIMLTGNFVLTRVN
jgi:hypothetical protein